ncbi:protein eva-1-like [Chironomus tepperi]|uniref:protein eva-1-like n=1 Tax=Chironomus tepperi TaxID=113505 RepID=UPI00391F5FDF
MDYNCIRLLHLQHHLQHKSPHFRISSLVLLFIVIPTLAADDFTRIDPLALLSGTLRTYQRAGCDHEYLQLSCPRGTTISIEFVQYGKYGINGAGLCPDTTENTQSDANVITSGTEIEIKAAEKCMWPQALQYSLLQIVVEACQKKRRCRFLSSPKTFGGDPCPGMRKFIEVAYKCRPSEFRSKVACENDIMSFECNPYSRIAVNAASFGRTEYESLQCPQQPGVKEENCLASYATEAVMQYCHGRRRCNITADQKTFGKPCQPDSRMYLKVIYTCLPRRLLIDRFESTPEPDEPLPYDDNEVDQEEELYDEDQFYKESDISPGPAPKLQSDLSKKPQQRPDNDPVFTPTVSSSISPPQHARDDSPIEENQERLYLLLIISVTSGVLLCLLIVIARWIFIRRKPSKDESSEQGKTPAQFKTSNTGETTITNGFSADDISEIDADIDLTTPLPMSTGSSSITRNDNFNTYTPSPSPYGNLGPSNISHTSSTLLMPQSSISSSSGTTGTPSLLSGSINPALILPPPSSHSATMTTGFVNMPSLNLSGTLPRQHPVVSMGGLSLIQSQQPSYIGGTIIGHPTLRRQSSHDMEQQQNMPRFINRNTGNVQYYYG